MGHVLRSMDHFGRFDAITLTFEFTGIERLGHPVILLEEHPKVDDDILLFEQYEVF